MEIDALLMNEDFDGVGRAARVVRAPDHPVASPERELQPRQVPSQVPRVVRAPNDLRAHSSSPDGIRYSRKVEGAYRAIDLACRQVVGIDRPGKGGGCNEEIWVARRIRHCEAPHRKTSDSAPAAVSHRPVVSVNPCN